MVGALETICFAQPFGATNPVGCDDNHGQDAPTEQ